MRQITRIVLLCLVTGSLYAQSSSNIKAGDSSAAQVVDRDSYRKRLKEVLNENLANYQENKAANIQRKRLDDLRKYTAKVDFFFRRGMDTISVRATTKVLENKYEMAIEGILENPDSFLY